MLLRRAFASRVLYERAHARGLRSLIAQCAVVRNVFWSPFWHSSGCSARFYNIAKRPSVLKVFIDLSDKVPQGELEGG